MRMYVILKIYRDILWKFLQLHSKRLYLGQFFPVITWINSWYNNTFHSPGTTKKSNMPFKQQLCGIQKVFAKFENHLIFSHFKQNYANGDVVSSSTSMNTFWFYRKISKYWYLFIYTFILSIWSLRNVTVKY